MSFIDKIKSPFGTKTKGEIKPRKRKADRIVLLFIDAENIHNDPVTLYNSVREKYGTPRLAIAYSKWTSNPTRNPITQKYREAGFTPQTCDSGDNNADIMLSVQAMRYMYDYNDDPNNKYLVIGADGDRGYSHIFGEAKRLGWKPILLTDIPEENINPILRGSAGEIFHPSQKKPKSSTPGVQGKGSTTRNKQQVKAPSIVVKGMKSDNIKKKAEEKGKPKSKNPPSVVDKDAKKITIRGFSTGIRKNHKSMCYPDKPKDVVEVLDIFYSNRKKGVTWGEINLQIKKIDGVAERRISRVYNSLGKILGKKSETAVIDWEKVPDIVRMIALLKDQARQHCSEKKLVDPANLPQIDDYFDFVLQLANSRPLKK